MNLLEVVSAIMRWVHCHWHKNHYYTQADCSPAFLFQVKEKKVEKSESRKRATDFQRQTFYFLVFIQRLKNKFKTVCRKTFSDLWHTVSNAKALNKNQL